MTEQLKVLPASAEDQRIQRPLLAYSGSALTCIHPQIRHTYIHIKNK